MKEFILVNVLISVKCVKKHSPDIQLFGIIEEFIPVKNLIDVIYVVRPLIKLHI